MEREQCLSIFPPLLWVWWEMYVSISSISIFSIVITIYYLHICLIICVYMAAHLFHH